MRLIIHVKSNQRNTIFTTVIVRSIGWVGISILQSKMRNVSKIWIFRIAVVWASQQLLREIWKHCEEISAIFDENIKDRTKPTDKTRLKEQKQNDFYGEVWDYSIPEVQQPTVNLCDTKCDVNQHSYSIIAGTASVVGPRVCWNNKVVMSSKVWT